MHHTSWRFKFRMCHQWYFLIHDVTPRIAWKIHTLFCLLTILAMQNEIYSCFHRDAGKLPPKKTFFFCCYLLHTSCSLKYWPPLLIKRYTVPVPLKQSPRPTQRAFCQCSQASRDISKILKALQRCSTRFSSRTSTFWALSASIGCFIYSHADNL